MKIIIDDLESQEIAEFLTQHIDDMKAFSPPESKHALDLEGLRCSSVTFWSVRNNESIVACGALKEIDSKHCELKSMRTVVSERRTGVASLLLKHILKEAIKRQYSKVSLETGTMSFFKPAHQLYKKFGFKECDPFVNYIDDPNSLFMVKFLD